VRTVLLPDGAGSVVVVVRDGRLRIAVFGDMPLEGESSLAAGPGPARRAVNC
jgi:hypothetical protein